MLYVIHAADIRYGGLHGMEDWSIWQCNSEEEAVEIAIENSIEVINSYSAIYQEIEDEIQDYLNDIVEDTLSEDDIEKIREDFYAEDIDYAIYKVKEEFNLAQDFDIEYLENILHEDPENFIKEYCCEEC